ncbi:MAG: aminoglycoside/choline kinase family phosphotransferase [Methylophagaceae bacterium]|jgi:aminoglycoside/choline kinase family phosphotransferase
MDSRLEDIKTWVTGLLASEDFKIVPASNDASFRRYFRVSHQNSSWIVMDAPPEKEDIGPFIKMAQFLDIQQIHVPKIIAQESQKGFLLLTDFGSKAYLDALADDTAEPLYNDAIKSLIKIQCCETDSISLPQYDRALLQQELALFPKWFLSRHFDIKPPNHLQATFDLLIDNALSQPQVIVHRDYHSRNLMVVPNNNPGIIDFQDAVIGPISYDLVSLLRDSYIAWPQSKIDAWVLHYFNFAQQHDLLQNSDLKAFTRWFDLMGLQRHLKVLGIFCRLNYRDNKPNYMADLPQTLTYVIHVCQRYENLHQLAEFLSSIDKIIVLSK